MNYYQCQHKLHNCQPIQLICVNRQCQLERKMCVNCSAKKIHDNQQHKGNYIVNEQELEQLINGFKKIQFENQRLFGKYCFDESIVLQDKVQDLLNKIRIFDQIQKESKKETERILKDCSLQKYLELQCVNNIGLFQYFDDVQSKIQRQQQIDRQIELGNFNPWLEQHSSEFKKYSQLYRLDNEGIHQNEQNNENNANNDNNENSNNNDVNHLPQLIKYSSKMKQISQKFELKFKYINIVGIILTLLAIFFNFDFRYTKEYQELSQDIYGYKEKNYIQCDQYQSYYLKRGMFSNYISDYDQGIQLLQQEIKQNDKSTFALLNIAKSYQYLGQYNNAIQVYKNVIKLDPESVISYINSGNCFFQQNKFKIAIEMYNNALLIDPNNIDAINNKGMALFQLQQYQYALEQFGKATEINKYFIKALYNKGITENILCLYDDASDTFDKLLVFAPDDRDIIYQKGLNLYYQGKYKESNIFLDQDLNVESMNQKSINLFKQKLYDQAILVNDQVLKIDSTNTQAIKINRVLKGVYKGN